MCIFSGESRRLKKEAVPSVFVFSPEISQSVKQRRERRKRKLEAAEELDMSNCIGNEVEIVSEDSVPSLITVDEIQDRRDAEIQCNLLSPKTCRYSIDNFKENPKAISYYTGFDDFEHYMLFFYHIRTFSVPAKVSMHFIAP